MSYWKQSSNAQVQLANGQDFMSDQSISENCRKSYQDYILNTKGEDLPKKGNFYQTDWSYIDNANDAQYKATWNPNYSWGVMKMPAPKPKEERKKEDTVTTTTTSTETKTLSSPKAEESLARMADALEIIATIVSNKNIKTAKDLLTE